MTNKLIKFLGLGAAIVVLPLAAGCGGNATSPTAPEASRTSASSPDSAGLRAGAINPRGGALGHSMVAPSTTKSGPNAISERSSSTQIITLEVTLTGTAPNLKPTVSPYTAVVPFGFHGDIRLVPAPGEKGWSFKEITLADAARSPLPAPTFSQVVVGSSAITLQDLNAKAQSWDYLVSVERNGKVYWSDDPIINNQGGGG